MSKLSIIVIAAALALSACASAPTASSGEPHALVVSRVGVGADRTHPVKVVELDGVSLAGRNVYRVAPGPRTLRVIAYIDEGTATRSLPDPERTGYPAYDLELDVEAGMRYTIAARWDGPSAVDWTPVVLRAEEI